MGGRVGGQVGGKEGRWGGRESETGKDININQWHHSGSMSLL